MQFDELAHLALVGGGFLRTPYLTSTQDPAVNPRPGDAPVLSPQIIHIPSAGRRSGLTLADPAYRRVIFSSALCKRLTRDAAAQANQEGAGITFGFHDRPDRNMARVRLSPLLRHQGAQAMILDAPPSSPRRAVDVNTVPPADMAVGFLAFVARYWQELRHVDPSMLLEHKVPLQFDCDFDIIPMSSKSFTVYLPILGSVGKPIVYDATLGPSSFNPAGSPIGHFGTATVQPDGIGGWYIDLSIVPDGEAVLQLTLADDTGQVYSRSLVVQDGFPAGAVIKLPHAMAGVPYFATLPCSEILCRIHGQDCASGNLDSNVADMVLPPGLSIVENGTAIAGTPTGYGTNYGILPAEIAQEGLQGFGISLTVNRPPRSILTIAETLANDWSTGEYYACQFMPYGSTLVYGGHAYEFRRFLSNDETWPGMKTAPYLYGAASRQSAKAQEMAWNETP